MAQQSVGDAEAAATDHDYDRLRAARESQDCVDHDCFDKVVRLFNDCLFVSEAGCEKRKVVAAGEVSAAVE